MEQHKQGTFAVFCSANETFSRRKYKKRITGKIDFVVWLMSSSVWIYYWSSCTSLKIGSTMKTVCSCTDQNFNNVAPSKLPHNSLHYEAKIKTHSTKLYLFQRDNSRCVSQQWEIQMLLCCVLSFSTKREFDAPLLIDSSGKKCFIAHSLKKLNKIINWFSFIAS